MREEREERGNKKRRADNQTDGEQILDENREID